MSDHVTTWEQCTSWVLESFISCVFGIFPSLSCLFSRVMCINAQCMAFNYYLDQLMQCPMVYLTYQLYAKQMHRPDINEMSWSDAMCVSRQPPYSQPVHPQPSLSRSAALPVAPTSSPHGRSSAEAPSPQRPSPPPWAPGGRFASA